jgi:hypothetical protein
VLRLVKSNIHQGGVQGGLKGAWGCRVSVRVHPALRANGQQVLRGQANQSTIIMVTPARFAAKDTTSYLGQLGKQLNPIEYIGYTHQILNHYFPEKWIGFMHHHLLFDTGEHKTLKSSNDVLPRIRCCPHCDRRREAGAINAGGGADGHWARDIREVVVLHELVGTTFKPVSHLEKLSAAHRSVLRN